MRVRWFGQSAFLLEDSLRVLVDPFGDPGPLRQRGLRFDYPPIPPLQADLLLVTHEHQDHNAVETIAGIPQVIRSTAGRFDTPAGELLAIASEHDEAAGTRRGPNTIFVLTLGGLRVCHLGDFGQAALRSEQREAIGQIDLLMLPVGGGPTIDGAKAAALVRGLAPRLVFPIHYRTPALDFLEPPDAFLEALDDLELARSETSECESEALFAQHLRGAVVLLAPPRLAGEAGAVASVL